MRVRLVTTSPLRAALLVGILGASGCWKLEYSELVEGSVVFEPAAGGPEGWRVSFSELPLECPDGEPTRLYIVHPDEAEGPQRYAVVYHAGSFDWMFAASPGNPLSGAGYQPDLRLTSDWAFRKVFATLGMYPEEDPVEQSTGALVAALAEQGVISILPANCWGDLWHDYPGLVDNDYTKDGFSRQGRTAAEFAWRLIADYEAFAPVVDVNLPYEPDPTHAYAFGIGEGGRAVGELLHQGFGPTSLAVDSPLDDVSFYWEDPVDDEIVIGLERMFPGGAEGSQVGSLAYAPFLPPRMALVYGPDDPVLPAAAIAPLLERLAAEDDAWIQDVDGPGHTHLNDDLALARGVVSFVLDAPTWEPPEIEEPEELEPTAYCTAVAERDDKLDDVIDAVDVSVYGGDGVIDTLSRDFDHDGRDDELFLYNDAGLVARYGQDDDDDGVLDQEQTWTYDADGRQIGWTLDVGADGSINQSCEWTWEDDAVNRPVTITSMCDDQGDGTVDRVDTTYITYGWQAPVDTGEVHTGDTGETGDSAAPAGAGDPPDTVVAHEIDLDTDGSIDELHIYTYPWDDGTYSRPTSWSIDRGVDDVIDEAWTWAYNNLDQLTFEGHDVDGVGGLDYVRLITWDKEGHLLDEQIDEGGDSVFDIGWTYAYDSLWRDLLATGDEGVDGSPNVIIETTWTCDPPE